MHQSPSSTQSRTTLGLLLCAALLGGCESLTSSLKSSDGLERVDELLSHVERVQVESAVSKERAQAALEGLRALLAPEFRGDAAAAHTQLVTVVEQSIEQAEMLKRSMKPLKRTGEKVFEQWTADLESFGNISLRQRSQERLEATRTRYDAILSSAVAAQLAYDAFNGDLSDHALFLEHDFNSAAVAMIAGEQESLRSRAKELARRLDACAFACQNYVQFSAPGNQLDGDAAAKPDETLAETAAPAPAAEPAQQPPPASTPKKPKPKAQGKPTQPQSAPANPEPR